MELSSSFKSNVLFLPFFQIPVRTISLFSRIAIILLKGYCEREKTILHEKNLKHRKMILLINFIFDPTFFLTASYQILKNYAILINHESFFQKKDFPQLHRF